MSASTDATTTPATDTSTIRSSPQGVRPLALVAGVWAVQAFAAHALLLSGPEVVVAFGIEVIDLVRMIQLAGVVGILVGLGVGWVADRPRGPSRLHLFLGLSLLSGVALGIGGAFRGALGFGTASAVGAASHGAATGPAVSLLAEAYPSHLRGAVFARLGATVVAAQLAAFAGGAWVASSIGLRTSSVVLGGVLVALAAAAGALLRERPRTTSGDAPEARTSPRPLAARGFGGSLRATWAVRTFRRVFVGVAIAAFGVLGVVTFAAFFAVERYDLGVAQRGVVALPALLAVVVAGRFSAGLLARSQRLDPRRSVAVFGSFFGVAAGAVAVLALEPPLWLFAVALALAAVGVVLSGPGIFAIVTQVLPASVRATGSALLALAWLPSLLIGLGAFAAWSASTGAAAPLVASVPALLIGGAVIASAGTFFDLDRRAAVAVGRSGDEPDVLVRLSGVDAGYHGPAALVDVSLPIGVGAFVSVTGPTGSGKTTLLRVIAGEVPVSAGSVVVAGRDVTATLAVDRARQGVAYVASGEPLVEALTVREHLAVAGGRRVEQVVVADVLRAFPEVAASLDVAVRDLAFASRRLVGVAAAAVRGSRVLLLDEPCSGLDAEAADGLLAGLGQLAAGGRAVVVAERPGGPAAVWASQHVAVEAGGVRDVEDAAAAPRVQTVTSRSVATEGHAVGVRAVAMAMHEVSVDRGGRRVLDGVTFELDEGESLGLVGPSGSGTTTLLDAAAGLVAVSSGRVELAGVDVTASSSGARRAMGLVRRFDDARLFPSMTVNEAVLVARVGPVSAAATMRNTGLVPAARRAQRRDQERVDAILATLRLDPFRDRVLAELSTGIRRVVDLACALATEPRVLLLDRPTAGLGAAEAIGMAPLLRRVHRDTGCALLLVDDDPVVLERVVSHVVALADGRLGPRNAVAAAAHAAVPAAVGGAR